MKRILIIGVDSLIGKALYNALKKTFIVYGTSRKKETSFYNLNLRIMRLLYKITLLQVVIQRKRLRW